MYSFACRSLAAEQVGLHVGLQARGGIGAGSVLEAASKVSG